MDTSITTSISASIPGSWSVIDYNSFDPIVVPITASLSMSLENPITALIQTSSIPSSITTHSVPNLTSGSVLANSGSVIAVTKKKPNMSGLRPWKKGESGNKKGTKGPRVKEALVRNLTKRQQADIIAQKLIDGAKAGEDAKINMILKVEGAYQESPAVIVNNNSLTITPDLLNEVQKYIKDKGIDI